MSFNKYSWLYLDRAFGRTQFFRNVFELKGWNDLKIKELIDNENTKKPLSDQKIADLLSQEDMKVARRTVAKYREMLGILSSSKRKVK